MDFRDSADEAAFRARLRDWLSVHAKEFPTSGDEYWAKQGEWHRALYAGGFFGVTWPKEYGGQELPPAPAYAEISRARPTHDPADPLPGDPPSIVYQRMLRYPQRKIVLTGQMAKPDDEMLHAPTEVFVRRLYRDILGRFEGASGLAWWLATLDEKDGKPNVQRRREAVRAFAESPEATSTPKHAIYDLGRDALEEHPRTPATDPLFWLRYRSSMRVMEEIERGARPGAPLLPAGSDEEIVAQRLQALGYIE